MLTPNGLVPQDGLEPPTDGLEIRYSIQLSYWGNLLLYIESDPDEARTRDPNIKSVVLYLLSYRIDLWLLTVCLLNMSGRSFHQSCFCFESGPSGI